jgi:UDP-N-acetylmuramoyl-L-alanyl-D-glutamate--2,6-diaminopimelate ligase
MQLKQLLAQIPGLTTSEHPALNTEVTGLTTNSQAVQTGDLFIGMPGTRVDGGDFWVGAIAAGAIAAIVSPAAASKSAIPPETLVIATEDVALTCAQLAAAFNDYPTDKLKMIGVTGTNGKTTTTHLIEFLLERSQQQPMMMGTLYTRWAGFNQVAAHTTPFPVDLQKQLAQGVAAGCQQAIMEVSSHALAQGRALGCHYDVAVFTNLTQDHLDYHKDMDEYFAAKALLFSPQYLRGRAIINCDDAYGQQLITRLNAPDQCWTYSTEGKADLYLSDIVYGATGVSGKLHTPIGSIEFQSPLVGQFNLANMLAAIGTGLTLGLQLENMVAALPDFVGVPGRMERVQINPSQDISVIVDYAHTPDSLENLLKASRPFIAGKMICVFGCGGDRDRTKRPLMGKIAASLADRAVITSDNPRTEDAQAILQDVVAGVPSGISADVIADRAVAIQQAILQAQPGDGILIAGKGHEDYQIIGTEKIHFDDREQAQAALKLRSGKLRSGESS